MIRTAASRRPQVAIPSLSGGAHQARSKAFIRQSSEDNNHYYTINKLGPSLPKKPHDSKLFRISDLLLDLDDLDSKHVRPFAPDDEAQLQLKWDLNPTRERLKSRLGQAKEQLDRSRQKSFDIMKGPFNAWRLSSHDILSAALRGAPATPLIDSGEEAQRGDMGDLTASEALDPRNRLDTFHTICSENAISDYALGNDELLLQWLKTRQRVVQLRRQPSQTPPSPDTFIAALDEQTSISSLRRLVSKALSSGLDTTLFQVSKAPGKQAPRNFSSAIRRACGRILFQCDPLYPAHLETMAFLGNLRQRLSSDGLHIGGSLCGLGLRLSARIANSEATLKYLWLSFEHNIWTETPGQMMKDVLFALETYSAHLTTPSEAPPLDVSGRESLLQILTGLGEEDEASPVSFRSVALLFLSENSTVKERDDAVKALRAYISTLGKLGAVATLWKEWRLIGGGVEGNAQTGNNIQNCINAEDFVAAVGAALSVVALREESVPTHLGLAGCAMLDWQSIELQNPDAWLGSQQDARPIEGFPGGDTRAALDLPLDGWLNAVQRAAGPRGGPRSQSVGEMGGA